MAEGADLVSVLAHFGQVACALWASYDRVDGTGTGAEKAVGCGLVPFPFLLRAVLRYALIAEGALRRLIHSELPSAAQSGCPQNSLWMSPELLGYCACSSNPARMESFVVEILELADLETMLNRGIWRRKLEFVRAGATLPERVKSRKLDNID